MALSAPRFWWRPPDWRSRVLSPLSALYGAVASMRLEHAPRKPVGAPVLCVGNLVVGGSGKTPVAAALAGTALTMGLKPGLLSRGHGGKAGQARLVDPARDTADQVGDEPLLLARRAPVAVGAEREAGARLLVGLGCDFLLMDDGFQSARIGIDFALLVLDRRFGAGNGACLPGGPLRAPVAAQFAHADALLALGEGAAADPVMAQARGIGLPVHAGRLAAADPDAVKGRRVLAFAGIGHPQKFFRSLEEAGADVVLRRSFADHHPFGAAELAALAGQADAAGLALATTEKDAARLRGSAPPDFLARLLVLEIVARFEPADLPARLIEATQDAYARRRRL